MTFNECKEAEAEIELQRTTIADTMSDLAKAEAEVERLTTALAGIACWSTDHDDAKARANRALERYERD